MNAVIRTLHSLLVEQAQKTPQRKLLGCSERWMSCAQVLERVEAIGWELRLLGIHQGSYVCLPAHRTLESALVILALQAIGAVAVLTDPRQPPGQFLKQCEVHIPMDTYLTVNGSGISCPAGSFDLFRLPAKRLAPEPIDPTALSFLIFTSGTTGKSKAVMLSQYNFVNNLVDSQPLGDYRADDLALGALPLHHVFGLVLLAGIAVLGYGLFFPEKTDVSSLLESVQNQRLTRMNGVPSLYLAMAAQAEGFDLSSLRAGFIGASPCTSEQFRQIEQALGMTLIPVYGMSECIGISCGCHRDPQACRASGVGSFYSMNDGKLLDEEGREVPPGGTGEIHVRGPARMLGYYPKYLEPGGFFATGDLGYLDPEGNLHLSGRKKEIIIRNGNNLSPLRIEQALLSISGVQDAAVVGLPYWQQGEIPCAMVVCTDAAYGKLTEKLSRLLPKNELPVHILRASRLPRMSSGKTDKQKVREVIRQWME